jgi:peptide/nickel transport system ATP-binding protein
VHDPGSPLVRGGPVLRAAVVQQAASAQFHDYVETGAGDWERHPELVSSRGRLVACHFGGLKTLLSASGLHKSYQTGRQEVAALHGVSLLIREGESLGIVGSSGSGKSTLARILTGYLAPGAGTVLLEGTPLSPSWGAGARALRRRIQLVMQDPWEAVSSRMTVEELVREPLDLWKHGNREERWLAVAEALDSFGLPTSSTFLSSRSHQLSGGQLQRVVLARALVAQPKLLVADEPTSMLDASEQARLLVVLRERQIEMGLGLVLVSHDMAVVRKVTDRIIVLDRGRVVEEGPSNVVSVDPRHPTTRRLLQAASRLATTH